MAQPSSLKGSFKPIYSFGFNQHILPKGASYGIFDETRKLQIVAATTTNKIILQNTGKVYNYFKMINN